MKRSIRNVVCVLIVAFGLFGSVGCTALQDGFKAGISDGFSAALAAAIEAPFTYIIDHTFNAAD